MAWSPKGWRSEFPGRPEQQTQAWCYTDRYSYEAGETVRIFAISTTGSLELEVTRDGAHPRVVLRRPAVPARYQDTPSDCFRTGCGWPEVSRFDIDPDWDSGFYIVTVRVADDDGVVFEREHFFVVRPPRHRRRPYVLVLTTSTLMAYNDWGGASQYRGIGDNPRVDIGNPEASALRPLGRGFVRKPEGAPRESNIDMPVAGWQVRYPAYEWAMFHGYSRHHADAFWATYERPFAIWAERAGYALDYLTQHDLDRDPDVLTGHACVILVGHDEYWSWRMRDVIDEFVTAGGGVARFAGNMHTQIRLENDGTTQALYRIAEQDPIFTSQPHLSTATWDDPAVGRPAPSTFGLRATGYARYGASTPRSSGGYTIYRPHHWALEGTDLYYGDLVGGVPVGVVSFEVDGVDFTFHHGLPYPTFTDGAPESLEIIGMAPAVIGEEDRWGGRAPIGSGLVVDPETGALRDGQPPELGSGRDPRDWHYGAAMMATFINGRGTVFNAGTCEWVLGLMKHDFFVEKITHNVLRRLADRAAQGSTRA